MHWCPFQFTLFGISSTNYPWYLLPRLFRNIPQILFFHFAYFSQCPNKHLLLIQCPILFKIRGPSTSAKYVLLNPHYLIVSRIIDYSNIEELLHIVKLIKMNVLGILKEGLKLSIEIILFLISLSDLRFGIFTGTLAFLSFR